MASPERPPITPQRRYCCRYCGRELYAWLPTARQPNSALLRDHLADRHPVEAMPYLKRRQTKGIAPVAADAYELIEGDATGGLMDQPKQVPGGTPPTPETFEVHGQRLPVEKRQTYVLQQRTSMRYAVYLGAGMNNYLSVHPVKKTGHSSSRPAHWTHASGWDVVGIAHLSVAYDPPPPPSPPPTTWVGKFFARIGLGILPPGRTPVRTRVDALEFWPKDRHVSADWLSMPGGLRQGRGQTS